MLGNRFHQATGRFEKERGEMIELLRTRNIVDSRLLKAMESIPRHRFVGEPFVNRAYDDCALPIGRQQTISQPYTVALMTQCLDVHEGKKILEIGTGSGYQACVLAEMGARVYTIERHVELLNGARKRFDDLGFHIISKVGDGTIGWSEYAPFDGIIVTAAAPDVPQPLLQQLAQSGKLVIPVGDSEIQNVQIFTRTNDHYDMREEVGFRFVPLIGKKGWR
jgi:protein-L-isoaspartate(D-aspartate) O-methyltransferase